MFQQMNVQNNILISIVFLFLCFKSLKAQENIIIIDIDTLNPKVQFNNWTINENANGGYIFNVKNNKFYLNNGSLKRNQDTLILKKNQKFHFISTQDVLNFTIKERNELFSENKILYRLLSQKSNYINVFPLTYFDLSADLHHHEEILSKLRKEYREALIQYEREKLLNQMEIIKQKLDSID